MGSLQPRMRAGDADRQRVVEQLGKHFGEGRLTVAEFDERVTRAHASVYLDELPALTVDLPREPDPRYRSRPQRPHGPQMWLPQAAFVILLAMVFASAVVMIVHGAVPIFLFLLLFLFLRHRRWSRRW